MDENGDDGERRRRRKEEKKQQQKKRKKNKGRKGGSEEHDHQGDGATMVLPSASDAGSEGTGGAGAAGGGETAAVPSSRGAGASDGPWECPCGVRCAADSSICRICFGRRPR